MKVFVINLRRSAVRRELIEKQLTSQGVEFEIIEAVDGADLAPDYLAQVCDFEQLAKQPYHMHNGVYGCSLSHSHAYQRIIDQNLPHALVLEDDVVLRPDFAAALPELASAIQPEEVILLFVQNSYMPIVLSEQQAQPLLGSRYQLVYPLEPSAFESAAGCVVGRDAARGLLAATLPIRYPADSWGEFYTEGAIKSLRCTTPFLVQPAGLKSDIDYVSERSLMGRVSGIVDRYRIFPFKQLLKWRRIKKLAETTHYSFSPQPSPVFLAQPAS